MNEAKEYILSLVWNRCTRCDTVRPDVIRCMWEWNIGSLSICGIYTFCDDCVTLLGARVSQATK